MRRDHSGILASTHKHKHYLQSCITCMENVQKLLATVTILILVFHGFGCFGCCKDELDALLQLKSAINYPNGTALPDWKEEDMGRPSNCCEWPEVSCGIRTGRVVELYLDEVRQTDWYLNASLFLPFTHLQHLDLYGNSITGWTHHLRQLSSLEWLDLSSNKLKGMVDLYDIEALQNLKVLDLSNNGVDGFKRIHGSPRNTSQLEILFLYDITFQDARTVLDSILSFPALKSLRLAGNDFKGLIQTTDWLCQLKKNIQDLLVLDIADNNLHGEMPLCLENFTSLHLLDLGLNNLRGKLPLFLANFTSLGFLDLSSNQFVGNVADSPLMKLTSLQILSLSNNRFQISQTFRPFFNHSSLKFLLLDGIDLIPDNSTHQPLIPKFQLSFLSLSNCNISASLPPFILYQYSLRFLDLSHNYIEGSFPSWILDNNTVLVTLILANNFFEGSPYFSRYPHSHLELLDVSRNTITYLPTSLSRSLPNVLFLNLSKNSFEVISSLTFGDMKNLHWLDLSYNHLNGEMPKHWVKGCFSLKALFLSHNTLEVIPSLSSSSNLRVLGLSNNNFSTMIQSNLFPPSLEFLDLSNNHIGGQIPKKMCKLNYLRFLDLSNNRFSGFLPPCFNSPYLIHLRLYKNRLNGPLLPVFRNNTSLMTLDLGDNQLSGVIPEWIGSLRNLSILSLCNNHFEGHIPNQVCFLNQLTILDFSSNNISGQIPHCLGQMTFQPLQEKSIFEEDDTIVPKPDIYGDYVSYYYLERDSKGFFGVSFTNQNKMEITTKSHTYTYVGTDLDDMSGIDMSCNNLSGEIPLEIGSMIGVRALNLSHNGLNGMIPSTLSNLSEIESLDLSYNDLNGSIPFELVRLNALAVFSVAHNNLSGRTPEQKAQFGTFGESSYEGNPFLCGPPLLDDCSSSSPSPPQSHNVGDVDAWMDMDVFDVCFIVSFVIMFLTTLIVLYVNPHWRRVWFYYGEMWIACVYYFIVNGMGKAWNRDSA